jgi:hypothetical protein
VFVEVGSAPYPIWRLRLSWSRVLRGREREADRQRGALWANLLRRSESLPA